MKDTWVILILLETDTVICSLEVQEHNNYFRGFFPSKESLHHSIYQIFC